MYYYVVTSRALIRALNRDSFRATVLRWSACLLTARCSSGVAAWEGAASGPGIARHDGQLDLAHERADAVHPAAIDRLAAFVAADALLRGNMLGHVVCVYVGSVKKVRP